LEELHGNSQTMATRSFTGGAPAHMQDSLPALPAHLQSDTHLTAHLASR
jgi:chitin synthase